MTPGVPAAGTDGRVRVALLVEPDADTRELYSFALEQDQWKVAQARNGAEGWEQALNLRPDIVVSELALPGVDGIELCRRLREEPATRQIPIVIVTASAYPADLRRAADAGGDVVLPKPCLPDVLVERIREVCLQGRSGVGLDGFSPRATKATLDSPEGPGIVRPQQRTRGAA